MKHKINRAVFQEVLNRNSPPFKDPQWIIGGKERSAYASNKKYGTALRVHDNYQFEVLFKNWANTQ